jgi:hypothetical protein
MKYVALSIAVALLVANAAMVTYWTNEVEDEWKPDVPDDDEFVPIEAISVQVPAVRAGDIMQYDYEFFTELYELNRTSGNWSRITLEANGQLLEQIVGTSSLRDGYNQAHDTWTLHTEISMSLTITLIEFSPGEDNEPLIVTGRINGGRDRHATLKGDVPIVNYAGGLLAIDEIKGLDLPVTSFEFSVDNWAFPDPNINPERSLEETIYGQQAIVSEGDNGTYGEDTGWNYTQWYNWSVDRSERVRGYDSVRLNISLDFFGFLTLDKLIWLSSEVPRPVGVVYNSSTFWNEQYNTGHLILETSQMLQKNGYTRGGSAIPIQHSIKPTFTNKHSLAVTQPWEFSPSDGGTSGTSFDMGLKEALDVAFAESEGLHDWLRTHPSPLVTGAGYWAEEIDTRTTEYYWNITLEDEPGDWETWEDWGPTNGYTVNVTKRVERRLIGDDIVDTFLESENGPHWGASEVPESALSDELITLASSEDIWGSVDKVAAVAYTGIERKVDFNDARYFLVMGGINPAGFGVDLLDTLTGIQVPTSNLTWSLQVGNVWEGASTYMVGVDAETGRMLFITDVDGPQSLQLIFGSGD